MKKLFAILTASALLLSLAACAKEEPKPTETTAPETTAAATEEVTEATVVPELDVEMQEIRLGTSCVTMTVPASYQKGTLTKEDTADCQVAYYESDENPMDFDVYQWALADGETLEATAAAEADEYDAGITSFEVNGHVVYTYDVTEEFEGKEYLTCTMLMEDNGYVAEVVFWLDGEHVTEQLLAIMDTLTWNECPETAEGEIRLGLSSLTLCPPYAFTAGELNREDTDDVQVGYFCSEETDVDFDVYHWAKATDENLDEAAAEEAAEFEAELQETEINGHKFFFYSATEESDGEAYETLTYITEDGDFFVEIVFWLDGETAADDVAAILATLK